MRGTVLWWTVEKGYGKIHGEDENDYFVHYSGVSRQDGDRVNLEQGEIVEFEVKDGPRGLRAECVKPAAF